MELTAAPVADLAQDTIVPVREAGEAGLKQATLGEIAAFFEAEGIGGGGGGTGGGGSTTQTLDPMPAFQNGWVNYPGYLPLTVTKTGRVVTINGLVQSGPANTAIITLPVGWRPAADFNFSANVSGGIAQTNILPNGNVMAPNSGGASAYTSLSVSFIVPEADAYDGGAGGGKTYPNVLYEAAMAEIGTPATPVLNRQVNVSGVTRTAAGRYRITFATPFPDTDYEVIGTARFEEAASNSTIAVAVDRQVGRGRTTTHVDVTVMHVAGGGVTLSDAFDFLRVSVMRRQTIETSIDQHSFEPIKQFIAAGTESFFDLTLPLDYEDILISFVGQATGAAAPDVKLYVNGDYTDANYQSVTENRFGAGYLTSRLFTVPGTSGPATYPVNAEFTIPSYRNTKFLKVASGRNTQQDNANLFWNEYGWRWIAAGSATTAINTIRLALSAGLFTEGTRINIYGRRSQPQAYAANTGILGYKFFHDVIVGANSAAEENIPGMSISFTLPTAGVVELDLDVVIGRASGAVRAIIYIDGVKAPMAFPADAIYNSIGMAEHLNQSLKFKQMYELTAGTHTINIMASAVSSVTPANYKDRSMIVRRIA